MIQTLEARFASKVEPITESGCWIWLGTLDLGGYGQFAIGKRHRRAHRWAYEQRYGQIPRGLHIDHLCRVRCCVNPDHLEPVTCRENILRGEGTPAQHAKQTHCKRGHPFDKRNTYRAPRGDRRCRICARAYQKEFAAHNPTAAQTYRRNRYYRNLEASRAEQRQRYWKKKASVATAKESAP